MLGRADTLPAGALDISGIWRALTGENGSEARAHLRAGTVAAVSIRRQLDPAPLVMCRNGAAALLSREILAEIEAGDRWLA